MINTDYARITKPILFIIALIDFMGFSVALTILPDLFIQSGNNFLPEHFDHSTRLILVGVALSLYPMGQFLSVSTLGTISDKHGRKPTLVITLIGTIIASIAVALSIDFKIWYLLFIARFFLGCFAGNIAVVQASMVDISQPHERAANLSLIQLCAGIAGVIGAPLGSILSNSALVSWFNNSTPFWMLSIALTLTYILLQFKYKETLINFNNAPMKLHPLKGLVLTYEALTNKKAADIFWVWLFFISGWALCFPFFSTFFVINFGYTSNTVGPVLAYMGFIYACTQLFIARYFLKKYKTENILFSVMLLPTIAAIAICLSSGVISLYVTITLFSFSMGFTVPALLGTISKRGELNEQGNLLGKAQSIQALMTIIATFIGGELLSINSYSTTLLGGGLFLIAFALFLALIKHKKKISTVKI
ncbi:MFS transporter [Rickettsiales bacterium LUAb2]